MDKTTILACLSQSDAATFKQKGFQQVSFIPCFIPWQTIAGKEGIGSYCLYHGNMQVSENEEAAVWLLKNVFNVLQVQLIIAGKGISAKLKREAKEQANVKLVNDPSMQQIDALIKDAHINVLPSMNTTGVKLKLLNALFNGRHCLTNYNGVHGSQLTPYVVICEESQNWVQVVETLMQQPFEANVISKREGIMDLYNNKLNAEKLSELW